MRTNLTVDHVVPLSKGGKWAWENLVTACTRCNGKKVCCPLRHWLYQAVESPNLWVKHFHDKNTCEWVAARCAYRMAKVRRTGSYWRDVQCEKIPCT